MNRRHRERTTACVPFDVYFQARRLGRFWTCNVGQEGLFLNTGLLECFSGAILELRFQAEAKEHSLRGIVVHQVQGQGVGVQLAYWRTRNRLSHLAYLRFIIPNRLRQAA